MSDLRTSRFFVVGCLLAGAAGTTALLEACATSDSAPFGTTDNEDFTEAGGADTSSPAFDASLPPGADASPADDGSASFDAGADSALKDSSVDANDGAVDAGPTTSLFFLGDFAVNNTSQLGDALVPSAFANPVVITDGVHTATQVMAFDALASGTKIVVAADLTTSGRFDLVVANRNGTGAVTLATMPAAGNVTDIAISPDGTKVLYLADADVDEAFDAYVVPIAGGVAPVRVSPAHATTNVALDAQSISWSRDSVYVAVAGDFTVDKKNELFVADTSVAVPAPVAALAESALPAFGAGVTTDGVSTGLRPIWTSGGKVCVKADITGVAPQTFRFYCAAKNGTGFAEPTHLPALPALIGTYGISPDGATLAFSSDAKSAGAYEIYTMPADDSAAPARITSGTITAVTPTAFRGPSFFMPLAFSPDATKIAFIGDILTDTRDELFVVAADGSASEKRVAVVGTDGDVERDVTGLSWAPDSSGIAFLSDHRTNNDFELFRIPNVTTANQVPILVRGVVVSGDITDLLWRP